MYKKTTFSNGLKLITIPMQGTKTATILVMVGTGSKYEKKGNSGISHFLEHMFFKGTKKRPNTLAIASQLDSVGSEFNAFTGKEYTGYWVKVDGSKLTLAVDIVSDMLLNSKFASKEIAKEKGTIIEEINMYNDNPIMHIEDVFEECLYGDTPAGRDTIGAKKNILKFKREDFINYFNSQYGAESMVICLAGNLQPGAERMVNRFFNKLKSSNFKEKPAVIEKQDKPKAKVLYKKTDQATLSLGVRAFPIDHPNEFILKVISIILGGSMSSRLFTELRERHGLAYYVKTQTELYTDTGYLTTQAGVPVNKIEKAIKIILDEYKKMTRSLVSKKELARIKDLVFGRSAIQLESSDNMATWHGQQIILRKKVFTPEDFLKSVNKVTARDIKRVASSIFINRGLNLAVIGPFRDGKKFEKILRFVK